MLPRQLSNAELHQLAHAIVVRRVNRLRHATWVVGGLAIIFTGPVVADEVLTLAIPEAAKFMSGDQQFYLAIGAMFVNTIFLVMTYFKAAATHGLVNSELAEFKRLLAQNAVRAQNDAHIAGVQEGIAREVRKDKTR